MRAVLLLLLAVGPAAAAPPTAPAPAPDAQGGPVEALREKTRTALRDLHRELQPLEALTGAYSEDALPTGAFDRETLRGRVTEALARLDGALSDFWPLWSASRLARGAQLMGTILSGADKAAEGSSFLDETEIDDFKAETKRMQERARAALAMEEAAHRAFQERRRARLYDRVLAGAGGAAAAALAAAALAWRR